MTLTYSCKKIFMKFHLLLVLLFLYMYQVPGPQLFHLPPLQQANGFGVSNSSNPQKKYSTAHADEEFNKMCKEYSLSSLKIAAGEFSRQNILGTGSFGEVYKGVLNDGTQVAIKVVHDPVQSGFESEIRIMSKYRHPNLLMLLGFARNGPERLLVYECMHYGDCEKILKNVKIGTTDFPWERRISILLDACKGLTYMLTSSPIVFHRDIKPSNILVDERWGAKMADFGLSCESPSPSVSTIKLNSSAGTVGYACPNYIQSGIVSEASEIYSFGTCILDFLTNKPPAVGSPIVPGQVLYLVDSLMNNVNGLISILDPSAKWPTSVAERLGKLVFACCHKNMNLRITFTQLVQELHATVNQSIMQKSLPQIEPLQQRTVAALPTSQPPNRNGIKQEQLILLSPRQPKANIQTRREDNSMAHRINFLVICFVHENATVSIPVTFSSGEYIFGRNSQNDVLNQLGLSVPLKLCVSREHFVLKEIGNKYLVQNLSGNGTVVESKEYLSEHNDSTEVRPGDVLQLVQTSAVGTQAPFLRVTLAEYDLENSDRGNWPQLHQVQRIDQTVAGLPVRRNS